MSLTACSACLEGAERLRYWRVQAANLQSEVSRLRAVLQDIADNSEECQYCSAEYYACQALLENK